MQSSSRSFSSSFLLQVGSRFTLCALLCSIVFFTSNTAVAQSAPGAISVGPAPAGIAINAVTNKIYVANSGSNNVSVIDGVTNAVSTVATGYYPFATAVNDATNKIYVVTNGNNVSVIDGVTNAVTPVTTGSYPFAISVNNATNKVYVANQNSDNVTVIDGATNAVSTVATGHMPYAVAVNAVTNKIYVANWGSNNVSVIDGVTNAVTTVATGVYPCALAVNTATNKIYVANYESYSVTVIDGATSATSTVAVNASPIAVATNENTNKIYVANHKSGNVTVIDGANNTTKTVAAGAGPRAVAVNPLGNRIYVANQWSNAVTVIDGATNATTTAATGYIPYFLAADSVNNKVYVANRGESTVTVLDGNMPMITSPPTGSKLPGSTVTFKWTGATGINDYQLALGTTPGGHDIDQVNAGSATSAIVDNVPTIGQTLYVTLSSSAGSSSYTYSEATAATPTPGTMISPTPGSTLTSSTVTFQWKAGEGVEWYTMYVGRAPENHDIAVVGSTLGTSATITNIPTVGSKFYVTLYSYYQGAYHPMVYEYYEKNSTNPTPATMISPAPGSTLTTYYYTDFTWDPGEGVDAYNLYVGTTPGAHDIAFVNAIYKTTARVWWIPSNGAQIYVTLFSLMKASGKYQSKSYVYKEYGSPVPAWMTSPANGSTLPGNTATFTWHYGWGATQYSLHVGTTRGAHDVAYVNAGKNLSATISNIPTNGGPLYVRLFSFYGSSSLKDFADYVYNQAGTQAPATMISPAAGTKFSGTSATFNWTAGSGVTQYSLYVGTKPGAHDVSFVNAGKSTSATVSNLPTNGGTVYVTLFSNFVTNVQSKAYTYTAAGTPAKAAMLTPANGSTLTGSTATFTWSAGTGVSGYNLYLGSNPGWHDLGFVNAGTKTSATVNNIPTIGGTLYVTLYSLINGSLQSNAYTYTESTAGTPAPATMTSPSPGTKLPGSTVTFQWTTGAGVSSYNLYIGSSPGMHDIAFVAASFQTSATVKNLPNNGSGVYVTLFSKINGAYQSRSYLYVAAGASAKATIISPTPGSALSGASATFTWTTGTGVSNYALYVGKSQGSHEYVFAPTAGTSLNVTNLPADGSTVYVRVYSFIAGGWQYADYSYLSAP